MPSIKKKKLSLEEDMLFIHWIILITISNKKLKIKSMFKIAPIENKQKIEIYPWVNQILKLSDI